MQLGIFTFLRRSHKVFPPIDGALPDGSIHEVAITGGPETAATVTTSRIEQPILPFPQPFHSAQYAYSLTLPPGWQLEASRPIAGSPPVDRFRGPAGLWVGIWNEPCPLRSLPEVPLAERAGTLPLADGTVVRFGAFAPSATDGSQFLEGRWLAMGKRWTVDVQVTAAGEQERLLEPLGPVLASFASDG